MRLYAGQYAEPQLGFYYYVARNYDPALGRFMSADTIVPGAGNPLAWDRYSYTVNNPIKFVDPSGHMFYDKDTAITGLNNPFIVSFSSEKGMVWTSQDKNVINHAAYQVGNRIAPAVNRSYLNMWKTGQIDTRPKRLSGRDAFLQIFGNITFVRKCVSCSTYFVNVRENLPEDSSLRHYYQDAETYNCYGSAVNSSTINTYSNAPSNSLSEEWAVHELAHILDMLLFSGGRNSLGYLATNRVGLSTNRGMQQSTQITSGEIFADMFLGYVFYEFAQNARGVDRSSFMNNNMGSWMEQLLTK